MATRDKKVKSSKSDDRKQGKKADDITILVDDSSIEPVEKALSDLTPEVGQNNDGFHTEGQGHVDLEAIPENVPPTDATKLTEIIITKYEGSYSRGQYDGLGECWFDGGNHYKGEFSQGLMHGEGIFTWTNGQIYKGEFRHNAITGKGLYTWPDGSYDGEVMNGMRHGVGSFNDSDGKKNYTGEWYYGKRHGKGRMNYEKEKDSFYDGDWVDNIRHGHGTRQYPSGNIYKGMWFNNERHGDGTMKWVDSNQMYIGQWEDGEQHGTGQHVWFVRRVAGSQYALRNTYNGEFVKGIRHGYGIFYYANGAKYEGYWFNNMKHGKGRFTFKNGRFYEGLFENDHIKEHPEFQMDGMTSPDLEGIRTRTPLPLENMSVHSNISSNTLGPSFQIDLAEIIKHPDWLISEEDGRQVTNVIKRHMSALKKIYDFYSSLGYYESSDNTFILSHIQFWRMLKDCKLHHKELSLLDMDRLLSYESGNAQNPHDRILFREFFNHIIVLAVHLFQDECQKDETPLYSACVNKLISEHILRYGCKVSGSFFHETRRAIHALEYIDDAYQVYRSACQPLKKKSDLCSMRMRDFLFLLKDLKLINADLTARKVVQVLTLDNPTATDEMEGYNMEYEITFLEFFEALVGCAERYVTEAVAKDPSSSPRGGSTMPGGSGDDIEIPKAAGADQISLLSEQTTAGGHKSAVLGADINEEVEDGKSSVAPNMASQSATPMQGQGHAMSTAQERVSSIGAAASASKPRTEHSGSAQQQRGTSVTGAVSPLKDPSQAGVSITIDADMDSIAEGAVFEQDGQDAALHMEVEDELDETRQFNFWTHQVFIFFVMKFFPAYHNYSVLHQLIKTPNIVMKINENHSPNCICRNKYPIDKEIPQDHPVALHESVTPANINTEPTTPVIEQ